MALPKKQVWYNSNLQVEGPPWNYANANQKPLVSELRQILVSDPWAPESVNSWFFVEAVGLFRYKVGDGASPVQARLTGALYRDNNSAPLKVTGVVILFEDEFFSIRVTAWVQAGSVNPTTFNFRVGMHPDSGTLYLNANYLSVLKFQDAADTHILVEEWPAFGTPPTETQPIAGNDTVTATKNTSKTITAASLLTNDTGGGLSLISVSNPINCTVSIVGGDVLFTPTTNFVGNATFDYTISNTVGPDIGSVTVSVADEAAWTDITQAMWQGNITDFAYSTGTVTANATDKTIMLATNLVATNQDFDIEGAASTFGPQNGPTVGWTNNGTLFNGFYPSSITAGLRNAGAAAGLVYAGDAVTLDGVAEIPGWLASHTWCLSRRNGTFYVLRDNVLYRTFSTFTSTAAGTFFILAHGGTTNFSLNGLRYRLGPDLPAIS